MPRVAGSDDRDTARTLNEWFSEEAFTFDCEGESLVGVLARPVRAGPTGVLVVVGGPQYRAGSHRQFVLLARHLARAGYPVLRIDFRGMGDASGAMRTFEEIESDLLAGVRRFKAACPQLDSIVLWGLCDGASAAAMFTESCKEVSGLVLVNPWLRSEATLAQTYLRNYYLGRLREREFWRRLFSRGFAFHESARSLLRLVAQATRRRGGGDRIGPVAARTDFRERMFDALTRFDGPVLVALCRRDLTAQEFSRGVSQNAAWQAALRRINVTMREHADADHTFSSAAWRDDIATMTLEWLERSYPSSAKRPHARG